MTSEVTVAAGRFSIEPHACFACGQLSEHGLHLDLHVEGETCWTELELSAAFQGWEGIAHGGIVATILDEVMAWALVATDAWGVTARMNIEFRRPVRVGKRIRAEGWLVERRRRLLSTAARLVDAETGAELATAEGVYVAAREERRRELKGRYGFGVRPSPGDAPGRVDEPDGADPEPAEPDPAQPERADPDATAGDGTGSREINVEAGGRALAGTS